MKKSVVENLVLNQEQRDWFSAANNKVGIYLITNTINDMKYVGQSLNIGGRWQEHLNQARRNKEKISPLQMDLRKYGIENFKFEILQECLPQELDDLEIFYIKQYNCLSSLGYNILRGGAAGLEGENNTNAKMTEALVYEIRELYTTDITKSQAYELCRNLISPNTFADIWNGKTWKKIHYDVYTEENKYKHKHQKARNHACVLSKQDVAFIRKCKEQGMRKKNVHDTYFPTVNINTFSCAWDGRTYSYL